MDRLRRAPVRILVPVVLPLILVWALLGPLLAAVASAAGPPFPDPATGQRVYDTAEIFNAMEHAQFGNPSGSFTSGNFGRVTSAKAGRIGQMSLKFLW